jgi:hypothetical protein
MHRISKIYPDLDSHEKLYFSPISQSQLEASKLLNHLSQAYQQRPSSAKPGACWDLSRNSFESLELALCAQPSSCSQP